MNFSGEISEDLAPPCNVEGLELEENVLGDTACNEQGVSECIPCDIAMITRFQFPCGHQVTDVQEQKSFCKSWYIVY